MNQAGSSGSSGPGDELSQQHQLEHVLPGPQPLPQPPPPPPPQSVPVKAPPPNIDPNVGDWPCSQCGNWNWAKRHHCNRCGAVRPHGLGHAPAQGSKASASIRSIPEVRLGANFKEKSILAQAVKAEGGVVPVFSGGSGPNYWSHGVVNKGMHSAIDPSVGDWECTCGNWNFAKRSACNKCGQSKQASAQGGRKAGEVSASLPNTDASHPTPMHNLAP